jgi:predicted nucleic acid-binding protein
VTIFVDSSALLKRYIDEEDRDRFVELLDADTSWVLARHARVEIRRALVTRLEPEPLSVARERFESDWSRSTIAELDDSTCELAGDLAEATGARTLDALHFAAAHRAGGGALPFLTADVRQAMIARSLGWTVLGV